MPSASTSTLIVVAPASASSAALKSRPLTSTGRISRASRGPGVNALPPGLLKRIAQPPDTSNGGSTARTKRP